MTKFSLYTCSLVLMALVLAYSPLYLTLNLQAPEHLSLLPLFCCCLAIKLILNQSIEMSNADKWVILGLFLLLLIPSYQIAWLCLLILASYLLTRADPIIKSAGTILLLSASQPLLATYMLKLFPNMILSWDAWLVSQLLSLVYQGISHEANLIMTPFPHDLLILRGCSSFTNLTAVCLLTLSLYRYHQLKITRYEGYYLVLLTGLLLSINLTRLYMMAVDINWYQWWHSEQGQMVYQLGFWCICLSSLYLAQIHKSRLADIQNEHARA
ncbi:hypothetical protein HR060_04775 [Catenovulum sp. SM1970]|uniref:hypothetical protein n=1 Tax=Marinifaba aquimaris TaxID=2741323 RepID=UPI0015737477|nr:hypothetical protein [Marinifaba aquimaris]NTS76176.1 hypothetical protein [Marinifaba aquimaris]